MHPRDLTVIRHPPRILGLKVIRQIQNFDAYLNCEKYDNLTLKTPELGKNSGFDDLFFVQQLIELMIILF